MFLNPSVLVVPMWLAASCFKNSNKKTYSSTKVLYSFLPPAEQPCYTCRQNQASLLIGISSSQAGIFSSQAVASSQPGADLTGSNPELVYEAAGVKGKSLPVRGAAENHRSLDIACWVSVVGKWSFTVCMHLYLVELLPTLSLLLVVP